ncbi:GAF domain-containing protein, partial [bacterium]
MDKIYKNKGDNLGMLSGVEGNGNPSFLSLKVGSALSTTNFLKESELTDSWLNTFLFEIMSRNEKMVNAAKEKVSDKLTKQYILELTRSKLVWISYMILPKITISAAEKLIDSLESRGVGIDVTYEFKSLRAQSYTMIGRNDLAFAITNEITEDPKFDNTLEKGMMLYGRLNGLLTSGQFRRLADEMEEAVDILEKNYSRLHTQQILFAYGHGSFIHDDALAWLGLIIDPDSKYLEIVKELATKYNHLDLEFWYYYPEIVRNSLIGSYDKIKFLQEKLMNIVKRMGKPVHHENRYNVCLAFAAVQNGQLLEAKALTKKITELGKRSGSHHQQANGLVLEGMIFQEENKFVESIEAFKQAVSLSESETGELKNDQLIPALYRLAESYIKNHELDLALEAAERSHNLSIEGDYENPYHLANTYRLLGRIYSERKDYEKAHDYLMQSLEIAKKNEMTIQEAFTQIVIGEIWLERKKFDLTRNTWQKSIAKFREINNEYQVNKILPRLNSVPKPSLITKNIPKKEEVKSVNYPPVNINSNIDTTSTPTDKAAEIGYKVMDLLSTLGIIGNKPTQAEEDISEENQQENRLLADRLKRVEQINNFGQILLGTIDLNKVLNSVIDRVMEVSEADRGFLILLNEKGELYSQVVKTKEGSAGENKLLSFSKTFTEDVLKTGHPLWVADAQADSRFATQKSVLAMDLRTVICVPLKENDKVIGLIYLDRQSVIRTFTEDDLNLVESFSTFASIAIINARLHQQAFEKNEKLEMLNELSRTISNAFTRDELLYKVLGFAIRITGAEIGYVLTGDELRCEVSLNKNGMREIEVQTSSSVINKVIESGKSVSLVDTMNDKTISTQASIMALDIRSVMCVPLLSHKKVLGVIYVSSKTLVKSFNSRDLSLLEDIVGQTALALENLSLLEVQIKQNQIKQELDIARNIQQSMLPSSDPLFENMEISGYSCSATEVGGDYYDYIHINDNRFAIAFGDVTGHGVSAGLLMAMAKSCMFVQCKVDPNVIPVMNALNSMILGGKTERRLRMGFLYTIFDLSDNTMTISSAGHPLPYYYKHEIRDLEPIKVIAGYQLGVKESTKFRETKVQLAPKDVLIYFTDGIVEARNLGGEEYGYDRFEEFLRINSYLSSKDLRDAIIDEYNNWVQGLEEADDDFKYVLKFR